MPSFDFIRHGVEQYVMVGVLEHIWPVRPLPEDTWTSLTVGDYARLMRSTADARPMWRNKLGDQPLLACASPQHLTPDEFRAAFLAIAAAPGPYVPALEWLLAHATPAQWATLSADDRARLLGSPAAGTRELGFWLVTDTYVPGRPMAITLRERLQARVRALTARLGAALPRPRPHRR